VTAYLTDLVVPAAGTVCEQPIDDGLGGGDDGEGDDGGVTDTARAIARANLSRSPRF
jgi:hypothetical protein